MVNFFIMDEKSLITLEFPKVLEKLAAYAAFSASQELARLLRPAPDLEEALRRQQLTREARLLISVNSDVSVGGASDIRPLIDLAGRMGVLSPQELLQVKNTLIVLRSLSRFFEHNSAQFPLLAELAVFMPPPAGLVDAISHAISERGDVVDDASPQLASIRRELKISHERLMSKLEHLVNDPRSGPMLQEAIITQRNGRYVVPLRAEFKGRLRSIVHDQSASGATLFVEPVAVVELNNRWHEMQLAERDEIRRILADLSGQVGRNAAEIIQAVISLAEYDLALSCAKFAEDLHASEPILTAMDDARIASGAKKHPGSSIRLFQGRHPLLDQNKVVPIDIDLDKDTYAIVITGPNTGGKTVTLKTVGLLALMAQAGLHIPAQSGSTFSFFENIYADIGDEQSIEQSLSTFSAHINNIVRILNQADPRALILLDELGAGTDPQEGAALARAILTELLERPVTCLVATHYPELKAFAHSTPGVVNACVEFNLRTLRPTYRLTIGLPGRSNALAIAERLGLPIQIVNAARSTLNPLDLRAEDLLDEIHHQRDLARRARGESERARHEAEILRRELEKRLEAIEDERRMILENARTSAENEISSLQSEIDQVRRSLARAHQPVDALTPLQEEVEALQTVVEKPIERKIHHKSGLSHPHQPLRLGERVTIRSLKTEGIVTSLGEDEIEVQIGNLRLRARRNDIARKSDVGQEPAKAVSEEVTETSGRTTMPSTLSRPSPGMELDLRGQRAEDALEAMDRYLENAYMVGMPFVRIIHGKGTGRLRQVIREALHQNPHVKRFEQGLQNEGGDGVTVAHLAVED